VRYSRVCLLSLHTPIPPTLTVEQRLRELGLWTVCHLSDSRRHAAVCLRRYRGCRAGRRRAAPRLRPVDNGAFIVTSVPRIQRRPISCSRPRVLVDVRQRSPAGRLTFGCINICSLNNKVDDLLEVRRDHKVDVLCLVETWHDVDSICFRRLRSDGYQIVDRPRPRPPSDCSTMSVNHGGVAIVSVPGVRLTSISLGSNPDSFEQVCARIVVGSLSSIVAVIYRPGSAPVTPTFFDDLSELLNRIVSYREPIYIVGDVNVRLDRLDDPNARRLTELLDVYGFSVRVDEPTHVRGGLLDVVATRSDLTPPPVTVHDVDLSDHHLLKWSVAVTKPAPCIESVNRRPWHLLDVDVLREALSASRLCQPDRWTDCTVDQLAELYDSEITQVLDKLVPLRTVTIRRRPSDPWFDQECRESKRVVRRLERSARSCGSPESITAWRTKRRAYRALLRQKRQHFWRAKIDAEKSSPRQLWRSIDALLGRGRAPPHDAVDAEQFHRYFDDKVASVRSATAGAPPPLIQPTSCSASFQCFQPVCADDVVDAVRALPDKSCASDPLPTSLLKAVVDVVAPFLVHLFNSSLSSGFVPEAFKTAFISPRLKKSDIDPADARSYRPISNLSVGSKLLERLVARQLLAHLNASGLLPRLQSAYRANHSTETAVLKVLSDILLAIDAGDLSALVLLDLSAAFDTVDHDILLRRLQTSYGINGVVLQWFRTYLIGRRQYVRIGSSSSTPAVIVCGVPQGSVLGPILFLLYTADLLSLIEDHGLRPHLYADDTQIYGFCSPSASLQLQNVISDCIDDVAAWMRSNRLQLNSAKTELLWSTTGRRLHQLPQFPLRVGSDQVAPTSVVRDLGIYIDSDVSMSTHVAKTVSACFAVLRQLRSVRRSLPRSVLQSLVSSLVLSRLDYGNATLAGIPSYLLQRLQSVMNSAARLVFSSSKYDHITPLLRQLHWLRAPERIEFKIAVLAYKCLHGTAPSYLVDELHRASDVEARRRLRSSSSSSLLVRRTRLSTVGDRAFPVAASRTWNSLPQHVTSAPSLSVFRDRLKTYLFSRSFP